MNRRVVITGAGIISPIGVGVDEFWRNCIEGKTSVAPIPEHWRHFSVPHSRVWSPLRDIDAETLGVARTERLQLDPVTVLALGAAREAIERAGFSVVPAEERTRAYILAGINNARVGIYIGTGLGGAITFLQNHTFHLLKQPRADLLSYADEYKSSGGHEKLSGILGRLNHGQRFNPFEVSMVMPNASGAMIGIKFTITGPNITYCLACASGTVAIGNAYRAVRDGHVDAAITGGCEYFGDEHGHIFRSFDVSGTLVRDCANPETANRPFDEKRSGFLFSQGGAAMLVLEELDHAQRRGANIIAELIGFAETFDAHSIMSLAPGGEQIERMVRMALSDAGLTAQDVDYVNAHGTGTKNNDQTEAEVIARVFGKRARINSTKALVGHTIGASGAIEALVTALSLREGRTHICKNLETPVLDLNFALDTERFDPRVGLSQSFAFGGHNAAVAMRRFD